MKDGFDRRTLLAGAGAAAAASAVGAGPALAHGAGTAAAGVDASRATRSASSCTRCATLPTRRATERARRIGYKRVEHAGFAVGRRRSSAALRTYGLRATSGHQGIPQPFDEAAWREQVADAVTVGQRYIVNPASPITFPPDGNVANIRAFRPRPSGGPTPPTSTGGLMRARPGCGSATTATSGSARGAHRRHAADRLRHHARRDRPAARALRARPLLGLVAHRDPVHLSPSATASGSSTSRTCGSSTTRRRSRTPARA